MLPNLKTSEQRKEVTNMSDFFKKEEKIEEQPMQPQTQEQPIEKVKIGEKEYSQEELSKLVGLGETAQEYETKWNRPIGEFYPDYTQKSQKLAEFEKADVERQKVELERKSKDGELTPEEARKVAREEATKIGLVTDEVLEERINKAVDNAFTAKAWVDQANDVIVEAEEKGQPKTTVDELLRYAGNKGFGLAVSAKELYKLKYESELDKWKEEQVNKIKPEGMITQEGAGASAKEPPSPPVITRDNLAQAIQESLTRGGRGG